MIKYLVHYGIKGQRWGVKHGPPYPLSSEEHSSVVNKDASFEGHSGPSNSKKLKKYGVVDPATVVLLSTILAANAANGLRKVIVNKHYKDVVTKQLEESKNNKIDSKSGLPLKSREYTEEEDIKAVNPAFKNYKAGTKNNCMLCTTTYELRKRGYDVTADESKTGYGSEKLQEFFPDSKVKTVDGSVDIRKYSEPNSDTISSRSSLKSLMDDIEHADSKALFNKTKKSLEAQGEGARGNIMVRFKRYIYMGHSMVYEIKNGKFRVIDTQTGQVYDDPEDLLSDAYTVEYMRTDNAKINWDSIKEAVRKWQ